jgi:hypothetical protein
MSKAVKDEEIDVDEGARGFAILIQQLADGAFHAELSEEMQGVCKKLSELAYAYGSKQRGTLTLTLSLSASDNGTVTVDADVKTKTPKPRRETSLFFMTKGSNLVRENPRQRKLPLREVPGTGPARDVEDRRGTRDAR